MEGLAYSCPPWRELLGPLLSSLPHDLGPRAPSTADRIGLCWTFPSLPPCLPPCPTSPPTQEAGALPVGVWSHWNVALWPLAVECPGWTWPGKQEGLKGGGRSAPWPWGGMEGKEVPSSVTSRVGPADTHHVGDQVGKWGWGTGLADKQAVSWVGPLAEPYPRGWAVRAAGVRRKGIQKQGGTDQNAEEAIVGGGQGEGGTRGAQPLCRRHICHFRNQIYWRVGNTLLNKLAPQLETPVLLNTLTLGKA